MRTPRLRLAALAGALALAPACLSDVHQIPRSDLARLAQTPPEQRGQQVRVVQKFYNETPPPDAEPVHSNTAVVVVHDHHHYDAPGPRQSYSPRPANAAKAASDDGKALIILAVLAAVGLAATEGSRFDGWVELHPMHPVHLFGYDGGYMAVPLAHLTPEHAAWARKAVVRETEGPWRRIARRPLDRRGLTYSVLLGQGVVADRGAPDEVGFSGHIQLGLFPTQQVGIVYDLAMGWSEDDLGETVFDLRNSGEIQFFPVAAGRLHAGLFGQAGFGQRLDDSVKGADKSSFLYGGGAQLQLDITTTLALTARAGATVIFGSTVRDITAGISIY